MKTIKLAVSVVLVVGSYSFCNAQSVEGSMEPIQRKVEITKELDQRVRKGAVRASGKKMQAMTMEQAKAHSAQQFAERQAKGLKRREVENAEKLTK